MLPKKPDLFGCQTRRLSTEHARQSLVKISQPRNAHFHSSAVRAPTDFDVGENHVLEPALQVAMVLARPSSHHHIRCIRAPRPFASGRSLPEDSLSSCLLPPCGDHCEPSARAKGNHDHHSARFDSIAPSCSNLFARLDRSAAQHVLHVQSVHGSFAEPLLRVRKAQVNCP